MTETVSARAALDTIEALYAPPMENRPDCINKPHGRIEYWTCKERGRCWRCAHLIRRVRVKAWRERDEDGMLRMMRADGRMITAREFHGEAGWKELQNKYEAKAADILNRAFEDPKWQ